MLNACLSEQQQQLEWETEGSQIGYCTIYIIQIDGGVRLTSALLFLCVPKHSGTQLSAIPGITQALIRSSFNKLELSFSGTQPTVCCWPCTGGKKIPALIGRVWFSQFFLSHRRIGCRVNRGSIVSTEICYYRMFYKLGFLDAISLVVWFFFFPSYFQFFNWAWEVERIFSYFSTAGELKSYIQSGLRDKIKPDPLSYSCSQRLQPFSTRDVRGSFSLLRAGSKSGLLASTPLYASWSWEDAWSSP